MHRRFSEALRGSLFMILQVVVAGKRPELKSTVLFRGVDGYWGWEVEGTGREVMGTMIPEFYSRSGEKNDIGSSSITRIRITHSTPRL